MESSQYCAPEVTVHELDDDVCRRWAGSEAGEVGETGGEGEAPSAIVRGGSGVAITDEAGLAAMSLPDGAAMIAKS